MSQSKMKFVIDEACVELLNNDDFQRSVQQIRPYTPLDTPRLANLWDLCRSTDPLGAILEIGCFQGGGALHLSNSCPERKIILAEGFGFKEIIPELDTVVHSWDNSIYYTKQTNMEIISNLFRNKNRNVDLVVGWFPDSCKDYVLPPLSFVHLDVDVYQATKDSLEFILPYLMPNALIVLDDYQRGMLGVDRAVSEFAAQHKEWSVVPLFPSQALIIKTGRSQ